MNNNWGSSIVFPDLNWKWKKFERPVSQKSRIVCCPLFFSADQNPTFGRIQRSPSKTIFRWRVQFLHVNHKSHGLAPCASLACETSGNLVNCEMDSSNDVWMYVKKAITVMWSNFETNFINVYSYVYQMGFHEELLIHLDDDLKESCLYRYVDRSMRSALCTFLIIQRMFSNWFGASQHEMTALQSWHSLGVPLHMPPPMEEPTHKVVFTDICR